MTANPYKRTPRPAHRNWLGHVDATIEEKNRYETMLGTRGRSGDQWDVWESVYSPVGPDGYPRRIWDRETGEIDPVTAAYWREHYDLGAHPAPGLGDARPETARQAAHLYRATWTTTTSTTPSTASRRSSKRADPPADAVVDYGDRAEHCWNGDHTRDNAYSRLRYPQMVLPWVVERMLDTAPAGADVDSWRY